MPGRAAPCASRRWLWTRASSWPGSGAASASRSPRTELSKLSLPFTASTTASRSVPSSRAQATPNRRAGTANARRAPRKSARPAKPASSADPGGSGGATRPLLMDARRILRQTSSAMTEWGGGPSGPPYPRGRSPSSVLLVPTKDLSREPRCTSATRNMDATAHSSLNEIHVFRLGVRELSGLEPPAWSPPRNKIGRVAKAREPVSTVRKSVDELCVDTMRTLAIDAVQKAESGHPGLPLGAAPMAYILWQKHLKHNPRDPEWPDRDRFVLSAGHGCMLLYCLLHLTGYDLSGGE